MSDTAATRQAMTPDPLLDYDLIVGNIFAPSRVAVVEVPSRSTMFRDRGAIHDDAPLLRAVSPDGEEDPVLPLP